VFNTDYSWILTKNRCRSNYFAEIFGFEEHGDMQQYTLAFYDGDCLFHGIHWGLIIYE